MSAVTSGTFYFVGVFVAGFVLGILRTLIVAPKVGSLVAVLIELPVILWFSWFVCARILRGSPKTACAAAVMGGVAFTLLLVAESLVSMLMLDRSFVEHLLLYAQREHQLGLFGQIAFALFPWYQTQQAAKVATLRSQ